MISVLFGVIVACVGWSTAFEVVSGDLSITISSLTGQISAAKIGKVEFAANGNTSVGTDSSTVGPIVVEGCGVGIVCVRRTVRTKEDDSPFAFFLADIVEIFAPSNIPGAIEWRVQVMSSNNSAWRGVVRSGLDMGRGGKVFVPREGPSDAMWIDPLSSIEQTSQLSRFCYGVNYQQWVNGGEGEATSVPLWSVSYPSASLSLLHEPVGVDTSSPVLGLTFDTDGSRSVAFSRWFHRFGQGSAKNGTTFRLFLIGDMTDDALRSGLRGFQDLYPILTSPYSPQAANELGVGMYSCANATSVNASMISSASATSNWDAHFWWPYIGLLPPCPSSAPCPTFTWSSNDGPSEDTNCGAFKHGEAVSRGLMAQQMTAWEADLGVKTLSYFNLFEFGQNVITSLPPSPPSPNDWKNSSIYLANHLIGGLQRLQDGKPVYTWQNAVVLDPGVEEVSSFFQAQAKEHWSAFGATSAFLGLAIDRTDHTTSFTFNRSDGTAWCGAPCSQLYAPFIALSGAIRKDMPQGLLMTANFAGSERVGLLQYLDGVYSEADDPKPNRAVNLVATATTRMPAVMWTYGIDDLTGAPGGFDGYMQRALYLAVFPYVPVLGNDHSINPGTKADSYYVTYGHLFHALQGAQWILTPHPLLAPSQPTPLLNAFTTPTATVAIATYTPLTPSTIPTTLTLSLVGTYSSCTFATPDSSWTPVEGQTSKNRTIFSTLPLSRGMVMLKCEL